MSNKPLRKYLLVPLIMVKARFIFKKKSLQVQATAIASASYKNNQQEPSEKLLLGIFCGSIHLCVYLY